MTYARMFWCTHRVSNSFLWTSYSLIRRSRSRSLPCSWKDVILSKAECILDLKVSPGLFLNICFTIDEYQSNNGSEKKSNHSKGKAVWTCLGCRCLCLERLCSTSSFLQSRASCRHFPFMALTLSLKIAFRAYTCLPIASVELGFQIQFWKLTSLIRYLTSKVEVSVEPR